MCIEKKKSNFFVSKHTQKRMCIVATFHDRTFNAHSKRHV